jgi:hypothetical protein
MIGMRCTLPRYRGPERVATPVERDAHPHVGYVLGGALTVVAAIVSVTHFCIPSLIYNTLFRRSANARGCVAPPGRGRGGTDARDEAPDRVSR